MKLNTYVLIFKGLCVAITGFGMPFSAAIAQYANTGDWPTNIVWISILIGSFVGGANAIYAFLSSSFSDYKEEKKEEEVVATVAGSKF